MPRRTKIIVLCGFALMLALIIPLFHEDDGPVYKGRSLREWIQNVPKNKIDGSEEYKAARSEWDKVIRHYDTNAIPYLLEWIQIDDRPSLVSDAQKAVEDLLVRLHISSAAQKSSLPVGSVTAFATLGPRARTAIPGLERIMQAHIHEDTTKDLFAAHQQLKIIWACVLIGPEAFPALTNFYSQVSSLQKQYIFEGIFRWGTNAELAMPWLVNQPVIADAFPVLTNLYEHGDYARKEFILEGVRKWGTNAGPAMSWCLSESEILRTNQSRENLDPLQETNTTAK